MFPVISQCAYFMQATVQIVLLCVVSKHQVSCYLVTGISMQETIAFLFEQAHVILGLPIYTVVDLSNCVKIFPV